MHPHTITVVTAIKMNRCVGLKHRDHRVVRTGAGTQVYPRARCRIDCLRADGKNTCEHPGTKPDCSEVA